MVAERWHESKASFRKELRQPGVEPPANDLWDWEDKGATTTPEFHRFLAVMTDEIQGMMMLATVPQSSRKLGREDDPLIYIEYLESAPWNLPEYVGRNTRYRGVGFSLLNAAVAVSVELGCGGRLGLHSLPGARSFYERAGYQRIGFDASENLDWFERSGVTMKEGVANEPA